MGLLGDYFSNRKENREAEAAYRREHPSRDYSGGSSGTRRVKYKAYCRICGTYTLSEYYSKPSAIDDLQRHMHVFIGSNSCGRGNHRPDFEEVEE